jgi:hypothetical protein
MLALPCSDHVAQGTDRGPGSGAMIQMLVPQQTQVDLFLELKYCPTFVSSSENPLRTLETVYKKKDTPR